MTTFSLEDFPSELRFDRLSDRWVVIASGRANRPHDDWKPVASGAPRPDPFDPANVRPEEIVDRIANGDGTKYSVPSTWKVLAVKNVYPLVSPNHTHLKLKGATISGYGFHEIVIHSPDLTKNFEDFTPEQTQLVLEMYLKRYNRLSHQPDVKYVQVFTNRGAEAGASIPHPHSQIVALPIVPPYVCDLIRAAREHSRTQENGDVVKEEIFREIRESTRVVYETSKFLVYCPFAPRADYHVRIMPKQPGGHFHEITAEQMEQLASVLNLAFRRLNRIAGVPPYNAFIRTAPTDMKAEDLGGFRWHIDVVPHLSTPGGLEIATDMDVVTVKPEDAAHALRQES